MPPHVLLSSLHLCVLLLCFMSILICFLCHALVLLPHVLLSDSVHLYLVTLGVCTLLCIVTVFLYPLSDGLCSRPIVLSYALYAFASDLCILQLLLILIDFIIHKYKGWFCLFSFSFFLVSNFCLKDSTFGSFSAPHDHYTLKYFSFKLRILNVMLKEPAQSLNRKRKHTVSLVISIN